MSVASIQLEFDREAELVLRAVGGGNMTAKAAKRHLHRIVSDAVELELICLQSYMRRSVMLQTRGPVLKGLENLT